MITIKDMIEKPTDNTPIIGNNVSTLKPTETFFIELCLHQSNRQARKWPLATFCRMSSSPWLSRRTPGNARHIYSVLRHREPSHEPVNTCRTLIQSVDVFGDQLFQHQCSWIYTIIICRKPLITSTIRYISCIHLCALKAKVLQGFREARSILILPGEAAAVRPVDHCRDLWEHFVPTLAIYINTELIGSMDGHRKSIQLWSYNSGDCL